MSSGFHALHKVLKDETRRRIILLLNERGNLSYTLLLNLLELHSTGRLNYHLKALGELVQKGDDGSYSLTEKGKLASRLLREFPESENPGRTKILKPKDALWAIMSNGLYLVPMAYFYDRGAINATWFYSLIVIFVVVCVFVVVLTKVPVSVRRTPSLRGMKWGYTVLGAWLGSVVGFFGGGLALVGFARLLGVARTDFVGIIWLVIDPVIGAILGAVAGYLYFTRRKHKQLYS
jgi:hypothetical protein